MKIEYLRNSFDFNYSQSTAIPPFDTCQPQVGSTPTSLWLLNHQISVIRVCTSNPSISTIPYMVLSANGLVPIYYNHIMFEQDLGHSQIENLSKSIDFN